ncbi:MAG: MFS transporter [Deltaproteobacteria bacterium]|nr:MFS transporter [Deltaproteobacteria bacterium]
MKNNSTDYLHSKGYSYYVFSLLFILFMFDYIDRMVIVSLFPFIKQEWGLSDTQCGLFVSAVYWAQFVFAFPISVLIDRWSRKKSIGLMAVFWSIATMICAFTKNFTQLFAARTAIGIGEAAYAPGGSAMISAMFPEKKRAMIMGIWNSAIPLGSAVGITLGGFIAVNYGWRHAFGIVALPGLIAALLFFTVKDYKTVDLVKNGNESELIKTKIKKSDIARKFIRTPSLILTYLGFAGNVFVTTSLLSWLPTYFHRIYDLPMEKAGMKASIVMLLAIIGAPLGGYLADMWLKKRKNARLVFPALSSIATAIILFVAFNLFAGTTQYIIMLFGGMAAIMFVPAAQATTQDLIHPGLRATSYSLCVIVQVLLGSSLGPIFIGAVSDRYDIQTAMSVLPFFCVIAGILFFIGSIFYEKDLEKVEKIDLVVEMENN